MNWVKANKFLTGFIIVMVIGLGILGFEVFTASGAYDDAAAAYNKQAGEFNRLRTSHPFPSKQNLDKYDDQKKEAAKVITDFQVDLAKKEFPLTPLSPTAFQDQLKASVTEVRKKAEDAGVKLPEKFFLGFEIYETKPPTPEASAPLGRQLKAIVWVVSQYLDNQIQITSLTRTDLPEERDAKGGGGNRQAGGGPGGGKGGKGGGRGENRDLVQYHPFVIAGTSKQSKMLNVLNTISGKDAPQFYVIRQVRIRNSMDKGPSKNKPDLGGAPADGAKAPSYIVGEEVNELLADIDIVHFSAPTEANSVADKSTSTGR